MKKQTFTLEELTQNPSFIRWATGHANTDEKKQWDEWVEHSEVRRKLAIQAQSLITGISFEVPPARYREEDWKGIKQEVFGRQQKQIGALRYKQTRKKDSLSLFLKVAAVVLIIALAGLVTLFVQREAEQAETQPVAVQTVSTKFSEKKTIALPDGSEIILASGSSLSYKENWLSQPTIRVTLESGEAFFSIQPDETGTRAVPRFEVETEDGTTAVLGTRFSVTTYGEGTRVVLEKGNVQVTPNAPDEADNAGGVTMAPGEMAQWSKAEGHITLTDVDPRIYTSWVTDHLYFDGTPLSYLADRIEKTYGVAVEVEEPSLMELKLSGSVDFYSLDALIAAVSDVLDIEITRKGEGRVMIEKSNSYSN